MLEENRRIMNMYLKKIGGAKISYTHFIGWAIVKAASEMSVMNNAFTMIDGAPYIIKKPDVNLGLAIDL